MNKFQTYLAGITFALSTIPFAAQADPTDDFGWVMVAQVHEGIEAAAVDTMIEDIIDTARGNTGVLVFNFARVDDKIYGYEMFDNQAAYFAYLSKVEPLIPELLKLWQPTSFVPTHKLPDNVLEVMTQLGAAQPDMVTSLQH